MLVFIGVVGLTGINRNVGSQAIAFDAWFVDSRRKSDVRFTHKVTLFSKMLNLINVIQLFTDWIIRLIT